MRRIRYPLKVKLKVEEGKEEGKREGEGKETSLRVSATLPPSNKAPKNSAKEAIMHACLRVKTFAPTEVAKPYERLPLNISLKLGKRKEERKEKKRKEKKRKEKKREERGKRKKEGMSGRERRTVGNIICSHPKRKNKREQHSEIKDPEKHDEIFF